MLAHVRAFRNIAVQLCQKRRHSVHDFLSARGLDELLETADEQGWTPNEVASQVIWQCCVENGCFNNFQIGFVAVVAYLNEQVRDLGHQAASDLLSILNGAPTLDAIRQWVQSNYR